MKISIFREKYIKEIFTMKDAINSVKEAMKIYSNGNSNIPLRTNLTIKKNQGQSLYMPGYVEDANALGLKIVSIFSNNASRNIETIQSMMILLNDETGEIQGILDGGYLTKLRTGALAGAASDVLSKKDAKVFALFGTGGQAPLQLEAVLNVRNIELVKVFARNKDKTLKFVEEMKTLFSKKYNVEIVAAESSKDAVKDADIISAVTTSKEPVFNGNDIMDGVHINGMGSYMPDMQEIDETTLKRSNKIFVDTKDGTFSEAGDLIIAIKNGIISEKSINGEIGELLSNKVKGRENDKEITYFKSVGTSILDIVSAKKIYEKSINNSNCDIIEL